MVDPGMRDGLFSDKVCLSRSMVTLVINAYQRMNQGHIRIDVVLSSATPNDGDHAVLSVKFSVTDSGPHVSQRDCEHMWEPFATRDGSSGLGLFVVKSQAEALGGCCGMNNIPSGGTVFWFQLPYVPSHNSDTVAIDMPASPSSSNQISSAANRYGNDQGDAANLVKESQTILLIDDTESLLQLQALELVAYGYEVETAPGPTEAMVMMQRQTYGLVLCDFKMTNQNGAELTAEFREWELVNRPGAPMQKIQLVTAYECDEQLRQLCKAAGVTGVLQKPLDFTTVHSLMLR